jgi:manganese efflux pump family protein
MNFISSFLIAISLGMDCFAVSLCAGTTKLEKNWRYRFRIAFHFGLFQGGMTYLGWLVGTTIAQIVANYDHWIAFALLTWISIRMIREGFDLDQEACPTNPSRGMTLIMLSIATSIDALAIGLSLAVLQTNIIHASLLIGIVSLFLSLIGLAIGNRLGNLFGKRMEIIGGLTLGFIGIRILITHLIS